jgi:hypothetical protein
MLSSPKEQEDRKRRARPYEDFGREWLRKKLPEQALIVFGSWPDGKQTR